MGNLWTSTGTLLASATFTNETASGWQQVNFATPIAITANTVYVASYHTNVGEYADSQNYFASSAVNNPPLHALSGVYSYGTSSSFPNQSYEASNYWVDVVYAASGAVTTTTTTSTTSNAPATVTNLSASPTSVAPGGTQTLSAKVTASQSLNNATVTFTVLNSAGIAVFSASYPGQQLNSGSPETFQAAWMVPSSTPSGSYTLEATVTSANGSTTYASQQLAGGITIN